MCQGLPSARNVHHLCLIVWVKLPDAHQQGLSWRLHFKLAALILFLSVISKSHSDFASPSLYLWQEHIWYQSSAYHKCKTDDLACQHQDGLIRTQYSAVYSVAYAHKYVLPSSSLVPAAL